MKIIYKSLLYLCFVALIFSAASCTTRGPAGLFGKRSPHEAYGDKITTAGLKETTLGRSWFSAAEKSLVKALSVSIPYSETGYFAADKPEAAAVKFKVKRGEKLAINLTKKPVSGFSLYLDLWEVPENNAKPEALLSADTSKPQLEYEVKHDGFYLVRLQPELLASGEYTLSITTGPSLAFPVIEKANAKVGSFWGASRDAGARRHEGIDIFAPMRTPLVAAADGTVNRVEENRLGGKVIFLRPQNKDYTLYYAHLDEQLVKPGQSVKTGDVIGLMGKTGNAASTSPHLHFGIYTFSGAIDPLAFVNPVIKKPSPITVSTNLIGKWARSDGKTMRVYGEPSSSPSNYITLESNSLLRVQAASAGWYKVVLPDDQVGYLQGNGVNMLNKPLRTVTLPVAAPLYDLPTTDAARKLVLEKGDAVDVLGQFKDYLYVSGKDQEGWIPNATTVK